MVSYSRAPVEVRRIAKRVRRKYYKKFRKAKIIILMRSGKWHKYADIHVVSSKMRKAGIKGDYIITLNANKWSDLTFKQRRALLDHELCHMVHSVDKRGNIRFRLLRNHDVEEFTVIVRRYGKWEPALEHMYKAMRRV